MPIQKKSIAAPRNIPRETKAPALPSKTVLRPHRNQSMKKTASFFSAAGKN